MKIDEEKIIEIRKSVNIVDIIGEYISIEQKGRNYFAICPFHDDHNPSMSISPEKQIYTCFVCGAHGNVFNFIMDYENVSFIESVSMIAKRSGIPLDIGNYKKTTKNEKLDSLYDIYDFSNKFYQNVLNTKDGSNALNYLNNRGFTDEIIKTFEVGLSTKNQLTKILKSKNYSSESLLKSGISSGIDDRVYDTYTDRIMFPLWDLEGKCVGFSGRIYNNEDTSKYVNSKESDIFKKGNLLYNYHRAKDEIRRKKCVIVVEGFMDVIALYKVGIKNVVATMGTAVTPEQARLLKKLSTNVVLCFDGDSAGNKATLSCSTELMNIGISPGVVRLPDNLDPDEYIKKYGVEGINEYLSNPKSLLDYKIDYYKNNTDFNNSESVSEYIKKVVEELNNIDDKIVKEITIRNISDETNISIATINGMIKNKIVENVPKKRKTILLNKYEKSERMLLYHMLRHSEVIKIYENNKCFFPTSDFRALASEIIYYYNKHNSLCIADFLSYLNDKEELLNAFNKIDIIETTDNYTYEEIMDYINQLDNYNVVEQRKKLTNEFKKETDPNKRKEIANEISKLKERG